jgi:hypothetical protein
VVIQPEVNTSCNAANSSLPMDGREKGKKSLIINFLAVLKASSFLLRCRYGQLNGIMQDGL